jgi:hypothetical protein
LHHFCGRPSLEWPPKTLPKEIFCEPGYLPPSR